MKKSVKKLETQLMKNFLNLMKKQKRKSIICYFVRDEKPPKP